MSRAWPPTTSSGTRCPSQQESTWAATEARQEKVILEVVRKGIFVVKCWSISWTHLQMFSVSTVLGEKATDVKQSWEASAKLPDRRPSPRWTGRGPVNEGIMFGKLSTFFLILFFIFRSVHGVCMGMDVWMNVFTMLFLCADSGAWSKMSRAWPPMSAITTSSVTRCSSHQESAWGATEARQEKVILEVVRKGIFVVKCWRVCWTHLQIFSVSTVLGEKASDVKQSWEASAKSPDRRPSSRWTGRGPVNEGIMFGKLSAFSFLFHFFYVLGVCMECVLKWMCEWMSLRCHCLFLFCFVFWTSVAWKPWCLHIFLVLSLFFSAFFFRFFFFFPFLWFIRPSSLVLSFMSVFNCNAFLYMLFSLTEWTVSLFMHYPSMFLGILSARCSSVWLLKKIFSTSSLLLSYL